MLVRLGGKRLGVNAAGSVMIALLVLSAAPLLAQSSPPAPNSKPEEIIVITGSRIPRPNLTAVSPVTVVGSEEVKLQGAILTETLINTLPQVNPSQGAFLSNGSDGTATVDLRGFGATRTLVLINGRRLLPGDPTSSAPDINFVPSSLIKRVEVLTGGASSVYGSDAVAGVVNFILDDRLNGMRIDAQSGIYQHDNRNGSGIRPLLTAAAFSFPIGSAVDGGTQDVNGAYGLSGFGGRAHVTVYGGYRHLSPVTEIARDYSSCAIIPTSQAAPLSCSGSGFSAKGTFVTQIRGNFKPTEDRRFIAPSEIFNFVPYNFFQRPDRRFTAGGFADFEINNAIRPYGELMFMDDRTTAQIAPSGNFGNTRNINCDNPLLSAQQFALVCVDGNFIGQTPVFGANGTIIRIDGSPRSFVDPVTGQTYRRAALRIGRRNIEGGARKEINRHRDWRWVAGLKGELAEGLTYDASYLGGRVEQSRTHTADFLVSRLSNALDVVTDPATGQPACRSRLTGQEPTCAPWDVFALGAVSQASVDYLTATSILAGTVKQRVATATLTGQLDRWHLRSPWADESPAFNIGAEYRNDQVILDPDEHYQNADLAGSTEPVLPLSGSTSIKELFGELRIPLLTHRVIEDATIELGYRKSWLHNAGNRFTASSYKLAAELTPIRGVRFRASRQRAVRAPNIQELFAPIAPNSFASDPCVGPTPDAPFEQCQRTGVTAAQYGNLVRNPFEGIDGYQAISGGNIGLAPETAKTTTLGAVFQPRFLPGFTATLDWFDIRLKGYIAEVGGDLIMQTCLMTGDPYFCGRIHRDAEGTLWASPEGRIDDTNANFGAFSTNGIDIGAAYTHSLGKFGSANVEFIGTWMHAFKIDPGELAPTFDCAGLYGQFCNTPTPRWRHNLRTTWTSRNGVSLSLLWRHVNRIRADISTDDPTLSAPFHPAAEFIEAQDYFDATAGYRLGNLYSLRIGVRNLFDREPPVVIGGQFGACGPPYCNGNTFPQLYDPLGRYVFAGVTLHFRP